MKNKDDKEKNQDKEDKPKFSFKKLIFIILIIVVIIEAGVIFYYATKQSITLTLQNTLGVTLGSPIETTYIDSHADELGNGKKYIWIRYRSDNPNMAGTLKDAGWNELPVDESLINGLDESKKVWFTQESDAYWKYLKTNSDGSKYIVALYNYKSNNLYYYECD
jgi:hypothetical protein